MEILQSVLFSMTRVRLSLYEQRIITKVVEYAQVSLRGEAPRMMRRDVAHKDPNYHVRIPVAYILDEGNDHYNHVYDAARALMSRTFQFYDKEKKVWHASPIIYNVTIRNKSGYLDFYVDSQLIDVILAFSTGYKAYDLETALTLKSPAAVRLYVLMSHQESPLTFTVENLKEMFGVADKYSQTADFIKKVIEPARRSIADAHVDGFTYSRVKNGQKVVALTFFPAKAKPKEVSAEIISHEHNKVYLALRLYLTKYANFTTREVIANRKYLVQFAQIPDAPNLLQHIDHLSHRAQNPKGYIINSMKNEIAALAKGLPK